MINLHFNILINY